MATNHHQDLPPIGGYDKIQWKRNTPARGFRPTIWFAGFSLLTMYGFYKVGQGNREMVELSREKLWARIHILPLLKAEQDRDTLRRAEMYYEREKEIMKDIPWWDAKSVYSDPNEFRPPHTVLVGKQLDKDSFGPWIKSENRFGKDEEEPKLETKK